MVNGSHCQPTHTVRFDDVFDFPGFPLYELRRHLRDVVDVDIKHDPPLENRRGLVEVYRPIRRRIGIVWSVVIGPLAQGRQALEFGF